MTVADVCRCVLTVEKTYFQSHGTPGTICVEVPGLHPGRRFIRFVAMGGLTGCTFGSRGCCRSNARRDLSHAEDVSIARFVLLSNREPAQESIFYLRRSLVGVLTDDIIQAARQNQLHKLRSAL